MWKQKKTNFQVINNSKIIPKSFKCLQIINKWLKFLLQTIGKDTYRDKPLKCLWNPENLWKKVWRTGLSLLLLMSFSTLQAGHYPIRLAECSDRKSMIKWFDNNPVYFFSENVWQKYLWNLEKFVRVWARGSVNAQFLYWFCKMWTCY